MRRSINKEDQLKRNNRLSVMLNKREARALGIYCSRYRVTNKSEFLRETLMKAILKKFDDEHPTLWEEPEPTSSAGTKANLIISDFRFRISDFKSEFSNRAEGELGEANPQSAILKLDPQNKISVFPLVMGMKGLKRYIAEPTKRTPRIVLETGRIFIVGRSIPENPGEFYRPVFEWISQYVQINGHKTSIELGFEYINTSSTKWIYNIIKEIAEMKNLVENVRIIWYYDMGDEDMCELGFILKSLVDCPFFVVETEGVGQTPDDQVVFNAM